MSEPFYLLRPGWVRSVNDGQFHWIGARRLADLYGVPMRDCAVIDPMRRQVFPPYAVVLRPREDGDYRLPGYDEAPSGEGAVACGAGKAQNSVGSTVYFCGIQAK